MTARTIFAILIFAFAATGPAEASSVRDGIAALERHHYSTAASIFLPLAERGDANAQAYLGFMYANGYGVPQNYIESATWYTRAGEQGHHTAQYMLGMMYDKGQGVPQDYVEAHKWVSLAVAGATEKERRDWVRIRDAIATKLSLAQITEAQQRAVEWRAARWR